MLDQAKLAELRNVILCDVHEDTWLEIMDTLEALWKENAELKEELERAYEKNGASLRAWICEKGKREKLEAVAKAADEFCNGEWTSPNYQNLKKALAALREGK